MASEKAVTIKYYRLRGKHVEETDLYSWAEMFERGDRHVALTQVGDAEVSTVFLGIDHSFGHGPPLLFETMIFGGPENEECKRYSTWDEAAAGHDRAVALLRAMLHVKHSPEMQ